MDEQDSKDKIENDKFKISDFVKELASQGLATYFLTEDVLKTSFKDLKVPKELVGGVLDSLFKKKDEFYSLLVKEFGKVLSQVDISKEITKFLQNHEIKLDIKVAFEPKKEPLNDTKNSDKN